MIECKPVKLVTMDGRQLIIALDQIHAHDSVKLVKGEGLPVYSEAEEDETEQSRGYLYIRFDVEFPKMLN